MPLLDLYRAVREYSRDGRNAYHANTEKLLLRIAEVFSRTWDLGFTAFGGPPVHFQIAHQRFVEGRSGKTPWIDEQIVSDEFTDELHILIPRASIKSSSQYVKLYQVQAALRCYSPSL